MIISVNENGQVRSIPAQINQGSVGEKVQIIAPAFGGSLCKLSIIPPTGIEQEPIVCTMYQTADGPYVWEADLDANIVNNPGTCRYQVAFYAPNYDGQNPTLVKASEAGSFYVRKGVITIVPPTAADMASKTLDQIWNLLAVYENKFAEVDVARDDATSAATDAEASAKSAIKAKEDAESAKAQAQEAFNLANNARASAESAVLYIADTLQPQVEASAKNAQDAYLATYEIQHDVEEAKSKAIEAQGKAEEAKTGADQAKTNAESAKGLAEQAVVDAQAVLAEVNAKADHVTQRLSFSTAQAFLTWYQSNGTIVVDGNTYRPSDLKIGDDIYIKEKDVSDLWYSGITETDSRAYWFGLPFSALETNTIALSEEVARARLSATNAERDAESARQYMTEAQSKAQQTSDLADTLLEAQEQAIQAGADAVQASASANESKVSAQHSAEVAQEWAESISGIGLSVVDGRLCLTFMEV